MGIKKIIIGNGYLNLVETGTNTNGEANCFS